MSNEYKVFGNMPRRRFEEQFSRMASPDSTRTGISRPLVTRQPTDAMRATAKKLRTRAYHRRPGGGPGGKFR